ncbi:MAG TPA: PQQ-dependent sugar dehydrogenase [Candidatus Pseudomonas excrementavium]|uniref:PQQ-dependent sugar dehydrogenase n=1 Tax=Halopseudomonas bauzanensis TaxID=653930 RepID=UPI001C3ACEAE|nr:PQQ-dependent sugar dehydrogenase [Halopseudomonas bauzanensis]HIZ50118.1 PQQ-dependent sugar dehydrogenase [Candidatus Pseudomonas excrementavium]
MVPFRHSLIFLAALGLLAACDNSADSGNQNQTALPAATTQTEPDEPEAAADNAPAEDSEPADAEQADNSVAFSVTEVTQFDAPWAMTFLPDGRLLVTEMAGTLRLHDLASDNTGTISGVPEVAHAGQGGLGDVLLHPQFENNQQIYISYAEAGDGGSGAAVARARLALDENGGGTLEDLQVIWRQTPKVSGDGHFGHRLAFDSDGMLWITSSERQKFDPAQDMTSNLGKMIRLNDDGSVPDDNPFADQGEVAAQVWSLGHRNILGLAFDADGKLWIHEMGPKDGDELNLIVKGENYGYPLVSNGNHYDDTPIPDHDTRPEFKAPAITWTPVISPAGFIIYDGELFPDWQGSGFIGGLSSLGLVRVEFDGEKAREAERLDLQKRVREVEQGPDGAIWVLEDGTRGGNGALLKLTPQG